MHAHTYPGKRLIVFIRILIEKWTNQKFLIKSIVILVEIVKIKYEYSGSSLSFIFN